MESADIATSTSTMRPARRRVRAISTTIGVLLASYMLRFVSDILLAFLVPIISYSTSANEFGSGLLFFIVNILWATAPAAMGGMYWLALRRLQHRRLRVVVLEATGFGVIFFLVAGVLFSVLDFAMIRFIYGSEYYSSNLFFSGLLALIQPINIIVALLISGAFAIAVVNIARFFAFWPPLDISSGAKQDWRDFGIIWGLTMLIALTCQTGFILMNRYIAMHFSFEAMSSNSYLIFLRIFSFFAPIGIVATIACVDTLRELRNKPVVEIAPIHEDPFASSDGSFSLSFSPITEND